MIFFVNMMDFFFGNKSFIILFDENINGYNKGYDY